MIKIRVRKLIEFIEHWESVSQTLALGLLSTNVRTQTNLRWLGMVEASRTIRMLVFNDWVYVSQVMAPTRSVFE